MTHGRDCPHRCSQCAGITPKRVTHDGERLLVDGQPAGRRFDAARSSYRRYGKPITARPRR